MARDHDAAELAYQLRGGPVFPLLPGIKAWTPEGRKIPLARTVRQVAFVDLGLIIDHPDWWADLVNLGCPIILDVHFPFGAERQILSIQPGRNAKTRDLRKDAEMQDRWSDPERVMRAHDMMAQATIVSSPRAEWAALLTNPDIREIHVIPDVVDPASGYGYTDALILAINRAFVLNFPRSAPWWKRWTGHVVGAIIGGWARRRVAALVEAALVESDIDWEARANGKR